MQLTYSPKFKLIRHINWISLALTYACVYIGRFNFNLVKNDIGIIYHLDKAETGFIAACGFWTYAFSVGFHGIIVDRIGGKRALLIGLLGSAFLNLVIGLFFLQPGVTKVLVSMSLLWSLNMYFQGWTPLGVTKINSAWFHLRERGTFGGLFSAVLSLGYFITNTLGGFLLSRASWLWIWFIPSFLMFLLFIWNYQFIHEKPSDAGLDNIPTGDGSIPGEVTNTRIDVTQLYKIFFQRPALRFLIVAEFCTGLVRQGLLLYAVEYLDEIQNIPKTNPLFYTYGIVITVGAIMGGLISGWISDRWFDSRRAPSSFIFYLLQVVVFFGLAWSPMATKLSGQIFALILLGLGTMLVLGVHTILGGAASIDFGGTKGAATVVGIVDSFQYLGSGVAGFFIGWVLNNYGWNNGATFLPTQALMWGGALIPFSLFGALMMIKLWWDKPTDTGHPALK